MNDHNLDDLIIDTIAPKNNKTKGLLTIFALLIVVLIVAIILTKTLLKSPENSELAFEENLSDMIAPELKLQETIEEVKVAKPKEEPSIATIIEEEVTPPTKTSHKKTLAYEPSIDWRVGESLQNKKSTKKEILNIDEKKAFNASATVKDKKTTSIVNKVNPEEVPKVTPIKNKKNTKPIVSTPIIEKPQKVKKTIQKTQKTQKKVSPIKYYVQVGSFKETPSKRFLSVIRSSSFKYHITSPDKTGYKKLLIGPYKTRADVDKARDIVRDRIHKSAFVVQK